MVSDIFDLILGNVYLKFLATLVISLIVAYTAKLILRRILRPLARRTKTKIDDLVIKSLSSVIFYAVLVFGFRWGITHFQFDSAVLTNLIDTLLVILISIFLIRIITNFAKHWKSEWADKTESTADDRLIPLLEKILEAAVIILAIFFVLDVWDVNITPLLGTAGLAGIALSFAVKDSLANIFGGIQLVIDKTFKVGDKIQLESGEIGVILDVGLRSTKLKTYDNEVIFIPNGQLANARVKNFTVPDLSVRVNVDFGIEYGSDTEKVRNVILDAVKGTAGVLEYPEPVVQFTKMSDFSLDFVARAWVASYSVAYGMKVELTDVIYKTLGKAGIGIPFPTRTVYTKEMD
ncbi:MAG: mechanosensitive ion channel family protein [Candidatus Aminicenantaceae bacterium]